MRIAGREINDECTQCKNMLECELFKQGHGIHCERENVVAMMRCQMNHEESRTGKQQGGGGESSGTLRNGKL